MTKRSKAPAVVLVRPQLGENIGAVARAMSNFGLTDLRLVAPRDGWPNPDAKKTAAGAEEIIASAKIFKDVAAALADIGLAFATSARMRDIEKRVLEPAAAMAELKTATGAGTRTAILFGPERTGLISEDIGHCDTLVTIPTGKNSSLNLGQSSVVMFYEWLRQSEPPKSAVRDFPAIAPQKDWKELFDQLETYLDALNYYRTANKKPVMWQNLKNMLLRARFSAQEVRTLRGLLRVLWEGRKPRA